MNKKYDVAAFIWPAFTGKEPRAYQFWEKKIGEWQTVQTAIKKGNGSQWPRKPLWGYQDEADPEVMEMQIEEAVKHGVNVFIYDWYWYDRRPFLEQCLNDGFLKAKNTEKMKFCLMWANHNANNAWDKRLSDEDPLEVIWQGSVDRKEFDIIADRIINKYFIQPNYYLYDGCPVFMIYDISSFIDGVGNIEKANEALEYFRERVKKAGFKDLHLILVMNDVLNNTTGVDRLNSEYSLEQVTQGIRFDAATHYHFCHVVTPKGDYAKITEQVFGEWDKMNEKIDIPYYPNVALGWDNNPRFTKEMPFVVTNNTPENVGKMLQGAMDYIDAHEGQNPLIIVNSWNEWTESSYLEPDDLYGYGYLEVFKEKLK